MRTKYTKNVIALDLVFGVAIGLEPYPDDVWRSIWRESVAARDELRGWTKFAHVKKIVDHLEAEDASAAAILAVDAMLKTNGVEVKP